MEVAELREKLYEYISNADEEHLSALYEFAEENESTGNADKYDEATLNMFYQTRENHLNGISKSYSVEEAMKMIRQHKK